MASSSTKKSPKKWYRMDVEVVDWCSLRVYATSKKHALAQLEGKVELDEQTLDFGDQIHQQITETRPSDFSTRWKYKSLEVDEDQGNDP